jgi:hypothetical protein
MLLKEIIFQDVYGTPRPVRIEASDQIAEVKLPSGVRPGALQDLLISTLFPRDTPQATRMELASGQEAKVAAVFEHRGRDYRVLRRADSETVRLQVKESKGWRELAAGASAVDERLGQSLGRPDFEAFWCLNLWRFEQDPSHVRAFDIDAVDPQVREVILKYRVAVAVEKIEDEINASEAKVAERSKELGQGAALEEKLQKARAKLRDIEVSELSEEDLGLLKRRDDLMGEFEHQLDRLEEQEDTERRQIDLIIPDKPYRVPLFWVGLIVAVGAIVASFLEPGMRAVALVDVIGFGVVAWVVFNYYDGMERASVHQVRLESIKRRLNQVREERVATQERINHVLIHAGVRDQKEMSERVHKAEQLRGIIAKMEKRVDELRSDAGYMAALDEVEQLRKRIAQLEAEREELPENPLSSFQLENDLESLGVDPATVLEENPSDSEAEEELSPVGRLVKAAELTNQWDSVELHAKTRKMWGKICGHVLGNKFSSVAITDHGNLKIGDLDAEQIQMWRKTRPSEYEVLLRALALAIKVGAHDRSRRGVFESVVVADPSDYLTAVQVKKLQEVFASAARKSKIVILRTSQ